MLFTSRAACGTMSHMGKIKKKTKNHAARHIVLLVAAVAALVIIALVAVGLGQKEEQSADDLYEGMVQVFNGEQNIWISPQSGVPVNDLGSEDFSVDADGNISYDGIKYTALRGVDVSSYQGDIDWAQVYDSGVRFAIVRAGGMYYGSETGELYADDNFVANLEGAASAGLKVGAYFFSQATTEAEAMSEAEFVLGLLGDRKLDLPVFFDWERISGDEARTDNTASETLTACAKAFCETIEAAGYDAGIYIYNDTGYNGYDLAELTDYTFWAVGIANYPCFYYAHSLWQYSVSGSVPGIDGNCDLDMMFIEK